MLSLATLCASCRVPTYERDIRPLFVARCVQCHGVEATENGLDLRSLDALLVGGTSGPAVRGPDADRSLLFELVRDDLMPPDPPPLNASQIDRLRRWIEAGTPR